MKVLDRFPLPIETLITFSYIFFGIRKIFNEVYFMNVTVVEKCNVDQPITKIS